MRILVLLFLILLAIIIVSVVVSILGGPKIYDASHRLVSVFKKEKKEKSE